MKILFYVLLVAVGFSCSVRKETPEITIEQDVYDISTGSVYRFYNVPRGGSGTNTVFIVRNPREQELAVNSITVSGADATNFVLTNLPAMPATIAAGQSTAFGMIASFPTCSNYTAVVTVTYNGSQTLSFNVKGSGMVSYHTFETASDIWSWNAPSVATNTNRTSRRGLNSLYFLSANGNNADGCGIQAESGSWDTDLDPDGVCNALAFWVLDTQGNNSVRVKIFETSGAGTNFLELWTAKNAVQDKWTRVKIDFRDLTNIDLRHIDKIELGEWNAGEYYFDDIQAVNE